MLADPGSQAAGVRWEQADAAALAANGAVGLSGLRDAALLAVASDALLRVSELATLTAAGASVVEMQQAGRWKSPSMPGQYARHQLVSRGAVARRRYKT